jgi:hypothetical protein
MPTFYPLPSEGVEIAQMYAQSAGGNQSATAVAIASSGTITTAGPPQVDVSRLNPASAVTACVIQPGTTPGQQCWILNEAATANSVTMAASGTSNAAGGLNDVIPGGQGRLYVWDSLANSGAGLWFSTPQIATTTAFTQSGSAPATATSGTITTSGVNVARSSPASVITAAVLQAGTVAGQVVYVVNEATVANSIQFAASGTSNVADGANSIIPGGQGRFYVWDSGTSFWYEVTNLVGGALASIVSATAPATATSGTITTAGVGVAKSTPAAAVTAIVLQAGTYPGQEVVVINESTTGANTITFAASGTSNVANGVSSVISGLTCSKFVWDGALWFHVV